MTETANYLYGPVPSRRLGLSLGVDIMPYKICTLDCVYCQIGRTTQLTTDRSEYIPIELILAELKQRCKQGLECDYITIGGSGEPTLNSRLGDLITGIKRLTEIPVALLTNGTLFWMPEVRSECTGADVVMPSLDAGDRQTFEKINRPAGNISIEKLLDGLCAFRAEYSGQIWLEVLLTAGFNTAPKQLAAIKQQIERIAPNRVHLNTVVRPPADAGIRRLEVQQLQVIAEQLGPQCEIIVDFIGSRERLEALHAKAQDVLSMLKRRPCSLNDIANGLGISHNQAIKLIEDLEHHHQISRRQGDENTFFIVH